MVSRILAPLAGWCAALDEVPDEVFSHRMLGDGVAIDPTGDTLYAPCAGQVISVPASKHAVALRTADGIELLMHVGIDTVGLAGEGFTALTAVGAIVRAGDPLLRFDLDLLARRARSLLTPVLVTNASQLVQSNPGRRVQVGDLLLELQPALTATAAPSRAPVQEQVVRFVVPHPHGIHARPAALIANAAKPLPVEIRIEAHGRRASARSAVSILALGIRRGDEIALFAGGAGAAAALTSLKEAILGQVDTHGVAAPAVPAVVTAARVAPRPGSLAGVIASRGLGVGNAVRMRAVDIAVVETGHGFVHEHESFERARAEVRKQLTQRATVSSGAAREVTLAHLTFLDDEELVTATNRKIAEGASAAFAWRNTLRDSAEALRSLGDAHLAARIDDLVDLEMQVLQVLTGAAPATPVELPQRAVLIARDLRPSELLALDARRLAGICLAAGGPTSHVALLAAGLGVPALVALGSAVLDIPDDKALIVDAEEGVLIAPDAAQLAAAEQTLADRRRRGNAERAAAQAPCHTADGTRIEVFANLASTAEARSAVLNGAEGCGLLRTEFLFLERDTAPDEDEQLRQYQGIAAALDGRPLVIRTLDVGGDKPIPYLPLPAEENPALGLRGIRVGLWRPQLLREQLRAILRVAPAGQCRILLPMITDVAEVLAVRAMIDDIRRELPASPPLEIGAMVETPAAALLAAALLREVDFLSIGTNDLTQYTLAMDRGNGELAQRIDGLHPAVLSLIGRTAAAGAELGKLVAVCGGLASDPAAVPLLLGLGVRELSVVPALIPAHKTLIGSLTLDSCRRLAERALQLPGSAEVRALAAQFAGAPNKVTP